MIDSEIVKALECCTSSKGTCKDCPAFVKVDRSNCKKYFRGAIDLINRLQAENGIYETCNARKDEAIKHLESEVKRLQAENEELFLENQKLLSHILWGTKFNKKDFMKKINAEAYKEFAERLKDKSSKISLVCSGALVKTDYTIAGTDLDNLVKEMVGE